jgi:hypothetical protein
MTRSCILIGGAVIAALSFPAHANTGISDSQSSVIRLHAVVPVLCRVQLDVSPSGPDENGIVDLGFVDEFCNAPRGYRVVVQHSPDLEGAALISGGVRIPLSPTGETVMTDSFHPDLRRLTLSADLGQRPEEFRSLSVRIEAKA